MPENTEHRKKKTRNHSISKNFVITIKCVTTTKKREKVTGEIFETIITEKFPKLTLYTSQQIQESQ